MIEPIVDASLWSGSLSAFRSIPFDGAHVVITPHARPWHPVKNPVSIPRPYYPLIRLSVSVPSSWVLPPPRPSPGPVPLPSARSFAVPLPPKKRGAPRRVRGIPLTPPPPSIELVGVQKEEFKFGASRRKLAFRVQVPMRSSSDGSPRSNSTSPSPPSSASMFAAGEGQNHICPYCKASRTPLWRKLKELPGCPIVCNRCGLYYKTHKRFRPLELMA